VKLLIAISILLLASLAHGQFLTITGFVKDPTGRPYQSGTGRVVLVPQNQNWLINGTNPVQSPIAIGGLDSFGFFSISLPSTAVIAPQSANPQWQFSFCSQSYSIQPIPVCFTMTPLSLTTNQDLTATIQAQSALLPLIGGSVTSVGTGLGLTGGPITTVGTISFLPQYVKLRCETGLGDGLNAMTVGTYLQSFCYNDSGVTWTITGIRCFTDNSGASTLNATNGAGTGLLTGAITCGPAFVGGTQSGTVTVANGDFVKFTFVSDGASKQSSWVVSMTQWHNEKHHSNLRAVSCGKQMLCRYDVGAIHIWRKQFCCQYHSVYRNDERGGILLHNECWQLACLYCLGNNE
jgi:hypothetical protein